MSHPNMNKADRPKGLMDELPNNLTISLEGFPSSEQNETSCRPSSGFGIWLSSLSSERFQGLNPHNSPKSFRYRIPVEPFNVNLKANIVSSPSTYSTVSAKTTSLRPCSGKYGYSHQEEITPKYHKLVKVTSRHRGCEKS